MTAQLTLEELERTVSREFFGSYRYISDPIFDEWFGKAAVSFVCTSKEAKIEAVNAFLKEMEKRSGIKF